MKEKKESGIGSVSDGVFEVSIMNGFAQMLFPLLMLLM
jgi:hypothetical protein